jgi:hypothetical protein
MVDILVYDLSYFQSNYNFEYFDYGYANNITASTPSVYDFNLPINEKAYFVGHWYYYFYNIDGQPVNF